jgi:hypothetical protein
MAGGLYGCRPFYFYEGKNFKGGERNEEVVSHCFADRVIFAAVCFLGGCGKFQSEFSRLEFKFFDGEYGRGVFCKLYPLRLP